MSNKEYLQEVEVKLKRLAKNYGVVKKSYFNSEYIFLAAIPVPEIRRLQKAGFSFSEFSHSKQSRIWDYIWKNSKYFEALSLCLYYFDSLKVDLTLADWKTLKAWSAQIDNWAHSDGLSSLYANLHESFPDKIYPTYLRWNKSSKPWLRRLSVIGLFYYSSSRKTRQPAFNKVLPLLNNLIEDDHFYVQKAVGWTIREMYNVYPKRTWKLLQKEAKKIPAAGWQAATEKLSKVDKESLKKIRGNI
ncbi:MAG: DNA alkylation repair protein [Bdellovibrionota bacterium]